MEFVSIVHVLACRWMLVVAGALVAALGALAIAGGGLPFGPATASTATGVAESKVLIDTDSSYSNDLKGGTEVLGAQAALLATLIAGQREQREIARAVGIAPAELDVVVADITQPKIPSTLARSLSTVVDKPRRPHSITVRADSGVSIITIQTAAPDKAAATRLARAAAASLAAVTAERAPSVTRSLVVKPLGAVRALEVSVPGLGGPLLGIAAGIVLLGLWCCAIVVVSGLARAWRSFSSARTDPEPAKP